MKSKISIIKIVKQPINKNCWLSVEDNIGLKSIYSDFITPYDFIDFEGEVFYYDVIGSISNCFFFQLLRLSVFACQFFT